MANNVTPITYPVVFPSSINNIAGKLLSERNLSLILRSICSKHFIYTKNPKASTGNFNLTVGQYGVISPGIAIIDGYIVTISNNTTLLNIPTNTVAFGSVKTFYLALRMSKQNSPEGNVGNNTGINDVIYDSLAFEFLEDKLEDTDSTKYLYLYKMGITQNSIDTNTIEDLRVYSPFDVSSISAGAHDTTKTLKDVLDFIMENIRGLDPETDDFFDVGDRSITIEGENGIYDRLKYKFALPDYPDKPFINDMIVSGSEMLYDQGQIITLNGDSRLPNIVLPEAGYSKESRGVIFIDRNRRVTGQSYDPQNGNQILYLENGELYSAAEVNQNAFSVINIKNTNNSAFSVLVPSIEKLDTLDLYGTNNISITGSSTIESRRVVIDLSKNISVQSVSIAGKYTTMLIPYEDPNFPQFSGIGVTEGIEAKNGTIEEDLRVKGNLDVNGDASFGGDVNITQDINCSGIINADRVYSAVYNDYAEIYNCDDYSNLEPGDIIMLNPNTNGYCKATQENKHLVVGVYSDTYGFVVGGSSKIGMGVSINDPSEIPIGMCGRVLVKVVGPIMPGDLIEVSHINGVGIKSIDKKPGTIIGKCLQQKDSLGVERVTMQIMLS